jgi:hypothetical protein
MSLFGKNQPQQPTTPAATTDDTFHYSDAGKRRIAELRGGDGGGACSRATSRSTSS